MAGRIVEGFTTGAWMSNTYVLAARAGEGAVVIDPGQDADGIVAERLAEHGLRLEAVLLTHGHIDHVWSAATVADPAGVPAYIHPLDRFLLDEPGSALGAAVRFDIAIPAELRDLADGDVLNLGGVRLEVRHTPGHTPGHCVFITDGILFSGDLIFAGSVGRTDFPRGSHEDLIESIRRVVLPMDDEVVILSGHGGATKVGVERRTNPFVVGAPDLPRTRGL